MFLIFSQIIQEKIQGFDNFTSMFHFAALISISWANDLRRFAGY